MGNKAVVESQEVLILPVDAIKPNPYQPRKFFERASLVELADSIKAYGVLQPISVRYINGCSYELVAGERRLRASKMAGMTSIPAILVNIGEQDSAILAIIENLQRANLNFLEEAEGLKNLMHDYHFTQEELAVKLGKSQSAIANKIRILRLPKPVISQLLEHDLTERHARALLKLEDEHAQMEVVQRVAAGGLTVKRTEELVERVLLEHGQGGVKRKKGIKIKQFVRDIRIFLNTIKHAVDVMNSSGLKAKYAVEEREEGCDVKISIVY